MKRAQSLWWISGIAIGALAACADPAPAPAARAVIADAPAQRLWTGDRIAPAPAATPAASAVALIAQLAPRGTVALEPLATVAMAGGELVRVRQVVDGVAVDGGELRVLVGPGGALIAASGTVVPADVARDRSGFVLDAAAAVTRAVRALHGVDVGAGLHARAAAAGALDDATWFDGRGADVIVEQARARRMWHRDGDALVAAWVVETYTSSDDSTESVAYRTVIAARDGRVLAQRDLTESDTFRYRVWAEVAGDHRFLDGPTEDFSPNPSGAPGGGRPAFIAPSLVTVDGLNHGPGGAADPWLPTGAGATEGNNVDAYTDVNPPGGLSEGDFRAVVTAPGAFDRIYDLLGGPLLSTEQQQAAITQLFYSINWLHDDWYDAGFTEATGNGQNDNFGRGGVGGDGLLAEAQDGALDGNRNNANMATPDDGMSPRMQVFVWSGLEDETITAHPGERTNPSNGASYGPPSYDLTGGVVAGVDAGAPTSDGCTALTNGAAVAGKIVLVDRGGCSGKRKALDAQNAGAVGVVIAHNVAGMQAQALPDDDAISTPITIPVMSVGFADGAALRAQLEAGPVTITMHRTVGPDFDGSLDGALVAHEFGHYLHHRLSVCGTVMCGAMSEGWGDFNALLFMAKPDDDLTRTYAIGGYSFNGDQYFGLRRAPYSVDLTKNAFTFRLVADGEELPTTHPVAFGGFNAEVHNAGEIWAEALWEAYVGLQQARGSASFDETRRAMQRYVVAGLLLAPPDATFTETRDALLTAVKASSAADYATLAAGFARRGLGSCALSPERDSGDFVGAAESFDVKGHALVGGVSMTFDSDCDHDETLDVGDRATFTVPIVNDGALALADVTVTATTTTPGLTIVTAPLAVGALASYQSTTAAFQVRLDAGAGPIAGQVELTIASPGGCADTQTLTLPIRLAADDQASASASDDFNAQATPWTLDGPDAAAAWHHDLVTPLDRHWHGIDLGTNSDTVLTSPLLLAGSGDVTIAFDHTYDFERSDQFYDGGIIEFSEDNGASWSDIATIVDPGYDAALASDSGNSLGGMFAYGGQNPSFPAVDRVTLALGTRFAGKTFQIRFRLATDAAVGAPGWTIDNLAVTGITNKPFSIQIADDGTCTGDGGGDDDGGCCSTGSSPVAPIGAGLLVAALLVRRRRRA